MCLRLFIVLSALLFTGLAQAQSSKGFRLEVLGETVDIQLPDGSVIKARLTRNEFASYAADTFSFVHPSAFSVTKSDLGQGIIQHLMASAVGSIVIVQEYASLDPTSLNQLMLTEMTKESVAAGAQVTQQPTKRMTPGGKELNGLVATETGKSDVVDYEIVGYGKDGSGVLVVTRMDRSNAAADGAMMQKFWQSFEIK